MRTLIAVGCLLILGGGLSADNCAPPPLRFRKLTLTDRYYCDGVTAADIDCDGAVDIVAGPFWFAGPDFQTAHEFYLAEPLPPEKSPSNSMYSFVHDFSGNGWPDILVLGRVHLHPAVWHEHPGESLRDRPDQHWARHQAFERIRGESPTLVDLYGDGRPRLICHWDNRWGFVAPVPEDPRKPWTFRPLGAAGDSGSDEWPQFYHGQGVGDLNADGRLDLLLNDGWYEQPADAAEGPPEERVWTFHRGRFSDDRGGAQMFADDLDGDGDADVVTALNAHGYGLAWFEQLGPASDETPQEPSDSAPPAADAAPNSTVPRVRGSNNNAAPGDAPATVVIGERRFLRHMLMGARADEALFGVCFSQPHALAYADLDGDGRRDIVVGKRVWAHGPTGDVEPEAAPVLYWFRQTRTDAGRVMFEPHLIDSRSGVGVQITVADVNADGRPDLLTASKLGVFVLINEPFDRSRL